MSSHRFTLFSSLLILILLTTFGMAQTAGVTVITFSDRVLNEAWNSAPHYQAGGFNGPDYWRELIATRQWSRGCWKDDWKRCLISDRKPKPARTL